MNKIRPVDYICSPLNYTGGKYRLLSQIIPMFPDDINTFVDMFCGGCNVGVNVNAKTVVFNDFMPQLIDLYKAFKEKSVNDIYQYIKNTIDLFGLSLTNESGYNDLRKRYNVEKEALDLFMLCAYSFNHQIRFNGQGQFNMPFGKDRSCFNPQMDSNLRRFLSKIHSMECVFQQGSFEDFDYDSLSGGDFVYCDPPYLITDATYNSGWTEETERRLLGYLLKISDRGVRFAISNVLTHKGKMNDILWEWCERNGMVVTNLAFDYANANYHTLDRNPESSREVLATNYKPNLSPEKQTNALF